MAEESPQRCGTELNGPYPDSTPKHAYQYTNAYAAMHRQMTTNVTQAKQKSLSSSSQPGNHGFVTFGGRNGP